MLPPCLEDAADGDIVDPCDEVVPYLPQPKAVREHPTAVVCAASHHLRGRRGWFGCTRWVMNRSCGRGCWSLCL